MKTWIGSKSFIVSLLIHGVVIFAIIFVCLQESNHSMKATPVGNSTISVYLKENLAYASLHQGYNASVDQKKEVKNIGLASKQKTTQPGSLDTARKASAVKEERTTTTDNDLKQQLAIKGTAHSALLIKLHNMIQQQVNNLAEQIPSFLKGRKASIAFQLNAQGTPQSIRLNKSTGSSWLDQLALQAVKSIQLKTRHNKKSFLVTIAFN